ncbi:wax ester/triacylglycerol synthase domain-containing protein [Actinomycetospora termitidis]|uniref:diacylglycerol O-acyltransferase n=1 Tax=Actinomycetospora termitidis TaxID=3053470 RepID=A0ABT7MG80_9PSEU|nr:wax ester/triacylglycerol synthase domain-containing protein [Actinomycetospora sp. Odt1-22]MDL5159684.1 wax ester/triacylglycerol synthase family O-acyltransferase [Actinomycetospora sp. Odt1-22]
MTRRVNPAETVGAREIGNSGEYGTRVVVDSPRRLNALEAMMWRAEADPRLRHPVVIVDLLDVEPIWDRVLDSHDRATRSVPRLRDRVLEPWWGWGLPEWSADPSFSLAFHVRRMRLAEPGGLSSLLDVAATWAATPFDRARPPWEALLVTGLDGGGAGYLLKVHHSLADGVGLVQILSLLHGHGREPEPAGPVEVSPSRDGRSRFGLTAARTVGMLGAAPAALLGGVSAMVGVAAGHARHPVTAARDGAAFAASAARAAVPHHVHPSPLLRHRSLNRRFLVWDVELEGLRRAGRAAGGSLNDAYVAAVLGGVARYHRRMGEPVPARVPVGMPVNTRVGSDALGGNHWAGLRFAAPVGEDDAAVRIRLVRDIVAGLRQERITDALGLIAPLLAALPPVVLARVQGGATRGNDVQVSNIPGMTRLAFVAGARIERSYAFGPLPGGAVMVALLSDADTCHVGATVDPAAVTAPEVLTACVEEAFAEVLALG